MNIQSNIKINKKINIFDTNVLLKYQIYNGLFLSLPFKDIDQAGARLSIFTHRCEDGLKAKLTPQQIVETYLSRVNIPATRHFDLLFKFIQFIERQVVLFDVLEDATFSSINDMSNSGTVDDFLHKINITNKEYEFNKELENYKIRIVLTAHPTQFYPDTILGIILNMGHAIKINDLHTIQQLFLQMGLTRFSNKKKPTPLDEARSLVWYLEHVLYNAVPKIQEKIYCSSPNNSNIEIGFWPGGDRDGNPFVTHEVSLEVANMLKESIIKLYLKDLANLSFKLTFDNVYENIFTIIDNIKDKKYPSTSDLIEDLITIKNTLIEKYDNLYIDELEFLIIKITIFGFHFVKLDIRQNSKIHQNVINHILISNNITDNYLNLSQTEKINLLHLYKDNFEFLDNIENDEGSNELIKTFYAVSEIQKNNGEQSIERYIISNTASEANVFEVLFLINLINAKIKNETNNNEKSISACTEINLGIVPLFETITDLKNALQIMEALYQNNEYMSHLKKQNMHQTIMLGFSDGTKDGGYLKSNLSIYLAKKELSLQAKKHGIFIVFFDGRGGPPSRGGGNTRDFYHSMGKNIDINEIQLTIQGQTIYSNFGTIDSAIYNIEQLFTSGLSAKLFPHKIENINEFQESIMKTLADLAYDTYLDLKNDPLFIPYLEEISTLKYLAEANIGSRPAKRNKDENLRLDDLRAIPFVAAWAQLKQNILGFYGVGTAISTYIENEPNGIITLKQLYKESLFFKTLINNSMQSLAKSNFKITSYLANDDKFSNFWLKLESEYYLSIKMLLKISEHTELLENNLIINKSIATREAIIMPLLIIQQYAMMKLRNKDVENKSLYEKLVKKTLVANINASRNSI